MENLSLIKSLNEALWSRNVGRTFKLRRGFYKLVVKNLINLKSVKSVLIGSKVLLIFCIACDVSF